MATPSRTVRVFLSSTFRDFAEERDLLVRKVFPELRRKCRERQVELVDVDLRWGITEEEAQQGKVLPICLAEIDRSRPYFISFLGERYGWIPDQSEYDLSILLEQSWLEGHRGGTSVTELEILHGVLNNPQMAGRALFYFRDPAWSEGKGEAYASESDDEKARVSSLKDRIRKSGFPVVENYPDPEALAERVREDLWQWIDETFPEDSVPDSLTRERLKHEAYSAPRQRLYLGGEEYFKALDKAMNAEKFLPVLVTGLSGGGKSALLANWVPRWINLHPKTSVILHHLGAGADAAAPVRIVVRLMQEIARLTGDEFKPESDPEKQLEQLPQWLALGSAWAEREGRELLLVLDGLDKVSDRKDLRWFPSFLPAKVKLVVSCLEGAILQAAKGRLEWGPIEVNPFTPADQVCFIGEYLGRFRKSLTPKQTSILQGHPLSGNPMFLLTVLEELRVFGMHEQLDQRLLTLLSPPPSKGKGGLPSVDDVFEHVLARVEEDLGKHVVQSAVEAIWASRGGLYRDELLGVAQLTPAAWASLQIALDEGLYESGGRISFGHDYLHKAVQDRYNLTGKRKLKLHRRLAEYFATLPVDFATLPVDARVAEELPWQWEQASNRKKLKACLTDIELFVAMNKRNEYELLGYWLRMGEDVNAAYKAAWRKWIKRGFEYMAWGVELAIFLKTAGCHTDFILELLEDGRWFRHDILGPEDPETLMAMNNLANSYEDAGRLEEALDLYEEVLRLRREILGQEHPDTLDTINDLAIFYSHAGRLAEALELQEEVLQLRREKLGIEHPDTLSAMHNLAGSYVHAGRLKEALGLQEEVLQLRREKLGFEHPLTLMAMHNLAGSYVHAGRLEEALGHQEEVLQLRREKLGIEHPDTLSAMQNLAVSYSHAGRLEEALGLEEEVLQLRREKLGFEHPDTLKAMRNLAVSYSHAGRLEEALGLEEEVLQLRREKLGIEHPDTLNSVNNLGILLSDKGDYDGAEVLFRRALEGREKALGAEHPHTLTSVNNLGILLSDKGDYDGAEVLFRRALEGREKALGAEHPDTLNSVNSLGILLSDKGDYDGAEVLFRRALEGYEKALGAEHPDTLNSGHNLAILLNATQRRPDAITLLRRFASFSAASRDAVAYNLACYECLEGNHAQAKRLISEHLKLHAEMKEQALADEDFTAIHDWISELEV